jgi:hypothetical protein
MEEVFISHRSSDSGDRMAGLLFEELRARGVESFLDAERIGAGEEYTDRILEGISTSRIVVVLFEESGSTWVHLEAACAFFDAKLVPVSVDGAPVPPPYDQIHHESLHTSEPPGPAVARVADQVIRKLRGDKGSSPTERIRSQLNRSIRWGWWAVLAVPAIAVLQLGLTRVEWAWHLHLVLGSLYLGGMFFLPLSFSQALSARGYRAREAGFRTVDHAFWLWAALSITQPMVGLYGWFAREGSASVPGWLFVALCVYATSLAFALPAYALVRSAHADDRRRRGGSAVSGRLLLAYALFAYAFIMGVVVVSLMLARNVPGWLR